MNEISIIEKSRFSIIGIEGQGSSQRAIQWIRPLWEEAVERRSEVVSIIKEDEWGMMSGTESFLSPWGESGRYLAGWELKRFNDTLPGWKTWNIPASTFACIPTTISTISQSLEELQEFILQAPNLTRAGSTNEYYPPKFSGKPDDEFMLYMLVSKHCQQGSQGNVG